MTMTELLNNILQDKKKLLLAGILVFILFYFDLTVILKMQIGSVRTMGSKITKLKNDLTTFENDLKRMQEVKSKNTHSSGNEAKKIKKVISEDQVPALLEKISNLANQNNVLVAQIKPSRDTSKVKQDKNALSEKLGAFLIDMNISASYHNLGRFVSGLENDEVLMGLQSIKINAKQQDYLRQNINLLIRAYVKK
jgi:Tfp pilus assembly protein PilO